MEPCALIRMRMRAPAKLNLFLHITGRRPDGYHLLQSIFMLVDWCDTLHFDLLADGEHELTREVAAQAVGARSLRYDRAGEEHYNVVSAYIKSMRASDADAAVYWLARMLEAGEDVDFVARRMEM